VFVAPQQLARPVSALVGAFGGALVTVFVTVLVVSLRRRRGSIECPPSMWGAADVLGVRRNASQSEIRAAYLRLVKELHPDGREPGAEADAATERLRLINDAYQILKSISKEMGNPDRSKQAGANAVRTSPLRGFLARFIRQASLKRPTTTIETPPCMRLARLAKFVFPKRTYERYLSNGIAETQGEYTEALQEGDLRKAKWIRCRGAISFWVSVAKLLLVEPVIKVARNLWTISGK